MGETIGLLAYQDPFVEAVGQGLRARGWNAQEVRVGATKADEVPRFRVLLDRQAYLERALLAWSRAQALKGTYVVNNPFAFSGDDKFGEAVVARDLGIPTPRTILLPPKETEYEFGDILQVPDMDAAVAYTGLPAVLKPFRGWGWGEVTFAKDLAAVKEAYAASGRGVMLLQEYVRHDHYVRVLCVGQEATLPMKYEPTTRTYVYHERHLSELAGARVVEYTLGLNRALDYDLNAVEFALQGHQPVLIDGFNTVPDITPREYPAPYFRWAVETTADFLARLASGQRRNRIPRAYDPLNK